MNNIMPPKRLNILFVFFQVAEKANGGVNSMLEVILHLKGYHITALTQAETIANERLRGNGVEVIVAPHQLTGSGIWKKIQFAYWLRKIVKSQEFDIVHINDIRAYLHSFLAFISKRTPFIFNLRDTYPANKRYGWHWRSIAFSHGVLCLSQEMQQSLISRLPLRSYQRHESFVSWIYSIVDFNQFYPPKDEKEVKSLRSILKLPNDKILIAFVAKFDPKKQQLEYISNVLPKLPDNYCTVF
ncbi:MAG: glycosyltransferase, partial [Bacteroidota bacterium]